ncbi:MAG: response regulator transcription factor [Comamonas sp.]
MTRPDPLSTLPAASPPAALRVLVVDDHPRIREPLAQFLRHQGLAVETAGDLRTMASLLDQRRFDAVVLDVMLPDGDGSLACARVRTAYGLPVILLTARDTIDDRVRGFERGADDYVIKPFEPRELVARIRNVTRRHGATPARPPASIASITPETPATAVALSAIAPVAAPPTARRYAFDGWTFDAARGALRSPLQALQILSDSESRLLEVLLSHANHVLSRDHLLDLTRTRSRDGDLAYDRTIDRQISRLRRKLRAGATPLAEPLLRTVRGDGYTLVAHVARCDG